MSLGITKSGAISHFSPSAPDRHFLRYFPVPQANTDRGKVIQLDVLDLPDLLGMMCSRSLLAASDLGAWLQVDERERPAQRVWIRAMYR